MPEVHRLADVNIYDGEITDIPQGTVYANGMLISVDGSQVEGGPTTTANGSPTVFINGIPVNRRGDADSDGTPRAEGSPNVFIDDGATSGATNTSDAGGTQYNSTGGVSDGTPTPGSSNADGFKSISPTTLSTVNASSTQTVMSALEISGAIPPVERLPFGGDDGSYTAVAVAAMAVETTLPDVANIPETTLTTVEAWYIQKITKSLKDVGALPTGNKLPFGGDDANG